MSVNLQVLQQICEIFFNLHILKIVVAEIILGNTEYTYDNIC